MNLCMQRLKKGLVVILLSMLVMQPALVAYNYPLETYIAHFALSAEDTAEPMVQSNKVADIISPNLKQGIKDNTVLALFGQTAKRAPLTKVFLPFESWRELEIFSEANLFEKVDRTTTTFGKWTLADWLVDFAPMTDTSELHRRQHIIKSLLENEETFNLLERSLQAIKEVESSLLIFFLTKNSTRQQCLSQYYVSREIQEVLSWMPVGGEKFAHETISYFDRSPKLLLATNLLDRWGWTVAVYMLFCNVFQGFWKLKQSPTGIKQSFNEIFRGVSGDDKIFDMSEVKVGDVKDWLQKHLPSPLSWSGIKLTMLAILLLRVMYFNGKTNETVNSAIELPQSPFKLKNRIKFAYQVQTTVHNDFIKLKSALDLLHDTKKTIEAQTDLKSVLTESKSFFEFFEPTTKKTHSDSEERMQELKKILNTSTFKGKSSFFSNMGRIFAANTLMRESKEQWADLFRSIGSLDAYLSLAKLIKEHQGKAVTYCFPEYVTNATPVLEMKNFWNPAIDPEQVVPNDIEMGITKRNIILTGPNTGGKSTIAKAVIVNILLSRLGIAAASSMKITPFTNINVYMNVTDKIARGLSKFEAGAVLSKALLDRVISLQPHEFSFTAIDEIFEGTAPEDEAELSEYYARELAKQRHNIFMQITHCDRMKRMNTSEMVSPTCKLFEHYKVDIDIDAQGDLHRNYKLKPGISDQRVARKILEDHGLLPRSK